MLIHNKNIMDNQNRCSQESSFDDNRRIQRRIVQSKSKAIGQILQRLRKNSDEFIRGETKILKVRRKKTQAQQKRAYYKDTYQDVMKPGDAVLRVFSQSKPLNTGDPFMDIKQKNKLLFSQRAYTKMPNIMAGVCRKRVLTQTKQQKQNWIGRKFSEYDRLVTEQTGPLRLMLKKKMDIKSGFQTKKPIYGGKVKSINQLFSTFESSNNDFYNEISKACSTNTFTLKSKTLSSLQGSVSNIMLNNKSKAVKSEVRPDGKSYRFHTDYV